MILSKMQVPFLNGLGAMIEIRTMFSAEVRQHHSLCGFSQIESLLG